MNTIKQLGFLIKNISIYRDILEDEVIKCLTKILSLDCETVEQSSETYSKMFFLLCNSNFKGNLYEYIYDKVIYSENLFTIECSKGEFDNLQPFIIDAVKTDLNTLCKIANLTSAEIKEYISNKNPEMSKLVAFMPNFSNQSCNENWEINHFAKHCKAKGFGFYSKYSFFYLDAYNENVKIQPVCNPDKVDFSNLKGFEVQKEIIVENTKALLSGVRANNILLYGHRGTGKSSTVKAIVNEYKEDGLKLIEVSKESLKYLPKIIDLLANVPMKFIIFVDDLTFSDKDDSYTALKAVLEGSSNKLGDNMVLYATTNRRHLITEMFSAREGDEVHLKDTLDESASLSDRFGITVTFSSPTRTEYLAIVGKLAEDINLNLAKEELEKGAIAWSARRGNFSPRTAKQYIDYAIAQYNLEK